MGGLLHLVQRLQRGGTCCIVFYLFIRPLFAYRSVHARTLEIIIMLNMFCENIFDH